MAKEVLLVPQKAFLGGRIFNQGGVMGGVFSKPNVMLRDAMGRLGYELKTIDQSGNIPEAAAIVFFEMPEESNEYYRFCVGRGLQKKMYLVVNEPSVVHPPNHDPTKHGEFKRVMTWNEKLIDGKKYVPYNVMVPLKFGKRIKVPRKPFGGKKLLCLIFSNKYSPYPN
ncbi:MAG: hypothetical protein ABIF01_00315, partial [Candidatus Micrarchaeota archaeon]